MTKEPTNSWCYSTEILRLFWCICLKCGRIAEPDASRMSRNGLKWSIICLWRGKSRRMGGCMRRGEEWGWKCWLFWRLNILLKYRFFSMKWTNQNWLNSYASSESSVFCKPKKISNLKWKIYHSFSKVQPTTWTGGSFWYFIFNLDLSQLHFKKSKIHPSILNLPP